VATEHVIDLEHQRYADREYAGSLPESTAAAELAREKPQREALARLRCRMTDLACRPLHLDTSDLADLLILLGLNE
jgi:hypothetical protein